MAVTEKQRELRYWKQMYEISKRQYEGVKAQLDADPENLWLITRMEAYEQRYLECNDTYFSLLED